MKFWKLTKMKNKLNSANLGWPKFFWKRRRLWLRDGLSAWDFLRDCSLERKSVLCVCTIDWEIVWWREKERERERTSYCFRQRQSRAKIIDKKWRDLSLSGKSTLSLSNLMFRLLFFFAFSIQLFPSTVKSTEKHFLKDISTLDVLLVVNLIKVLWS